MPAAAEQRNSSLTKRSSFFVNNHNTTSRLFFTALLFGILLLSITPTSALAGATPASTTTARTATTMSEPTPSSSSSSQRIAAAAPAAFPLETLAAAANAYAAAHGIQVETKQQQPQQPQGGSSSFFQCAPVSLLPNAFPRAAFARAVELAPAFNLLVDRVSRDSAFLQRTLGGSVRAADPYTAQLLRLYTKIYVSDNDDNSKNSAAWARSADRLGIHRSDYMLNREKGSEHRYDIKQVELNTIASSFAGLATRVAEMHSHLLRRYAHAPAVGDDDDDSDSDSAQAQKAVRAFLAANREIVTTPGGGGTGTDDSDSDGSGGVPVDPALERLPAALNVAVQRYCQRNSVDAAGNNNKRCCVLFVVQEGETNTVDQRLLEFHLFEQHNIPVERRSLRQIASDVACDPDTGALTLNDGGGGTTEIAVVYFRAGYAPTDYPGGTDGVEWEARERLENSRATKCPSLGYHLAGTKKVQQELARPGVLERFFPSDHEQQQVVPALRRAFAGLYSLGEDAVAADLAAVREVLLQGAEGRYVLKPQREGGGYNFYGAQLAAKLKENVTLSDDGTEVLALDPKLGEYILMERLFPPQQTAILLRAGKVEGTGASVSELGCFGAIVASADGDAVHNEYAGFLLRTKFSHVDEGGVASGFATLSSPYLC